MKSINPDIFTFFKDLDKNNNRDWFESHKPRFKALESEVKDFNEIVKFGLEETDDIEKIKMFRIYRDVRFSKNKTPYKTHFGVSFHRKKPNLRGSYYMHLAPQNNFIASGFWNPNPMDLLRIRKDLEMDAQELRDVITDFTFKKVWGELQGDVVKTSPKGFNIDHPNIDLIRHKQFLFIKRFDDKSVLSSDFQKEVIKSFIAIRPFFDLMTNVLTTDLNGVSIL
ncbi:DUF2461 domain-containing protein [Flavobacteriaceae bacterium]|jgi:uncharacterized protein (TIGR02453 family)|nr:DUF2461 domain-containing protein [Flavobacteriaceae bacterium]